MGADGKTAITVGTTVAIVTLLAFLGSLSCGFINLDDPYYITNNPLIKSLDTGAVLRIFTEAHLGAWLPLTYLSFAIDHHFWGYNPVGYHLTNNLLHGVNGFLVVMLAHRLLRERFGVGLPDSRSMWTYPGMLLLAGLFFAVHPLRVESVAWAAERKDVLNGVFSLMSVLAYVAFARRGGAGRFPWYLLSLACFILSLLAKQVSVTLPVVLLLLDWYPLGRGGRGRILPLLLEKIPFFAVSLLITGVTISLAGKAVTSMQDMPLYVRALVSGNAIFEYCRLSLFPFGISPYFVLPKPLPYGYLVKTAIVLGVTLLLLRGAARRPAATVVWLVFLVLLAPVLAFLQTGDDIAMAARYTYLPSIAPGIAAACGMIRIAERLQAAGRRYAAAAFLVVIAALLAFHIGMTVKLVTVWRDTGTFWSRVIEMEPVGRAYGDRGVFYLINNRSAQAVADFDVAIGIALNSGLSSSYNLYAFRGVGLGDIGRFDEAVADFDRAIAIYPHPTYYKLRGDALQALGRSADAAEDFRRAGPNPPLIDWFERTQ